MFEDKKRFWIRLVIFWIGLAILVTASVALFLMLWITLMAPQPYGDIYYYWKFLVPPLAGGIILVLIGLYGRELGIRKIIIGSALITVIALAAYGAWIVITPKWAFKLTTGKSSYSLGENVQITVTLENLGYTPHSITSSITNPVKVSMEDARAPGAWQVWFSPYQVNKTTFTVSPNQPLVRTFTWNQTNTSSSWL